MTKVIDLTGQTFERLVVQKRTTNSLAGKACWICSCSCGNQIKVVGSDLRAGKTKSCGCLDRDRIIAFNQQRTGNKNHNWKEIPKQLRVRFNPTTKLCFQRDGYTCVCCGQHGKKLNAHHLYDWKHYPEKRFDLDNLVTLCENCHKLFHRLYGKSSGNTPRQFYEFVGVV